MAGLWYRAGTISVTNASKKVVGSGTLFKTTTFKPDKGHAFYGPDGKPYEIDYVESDTVLYLVKAYTGATASGQSYEIDITRTSTIPALSREISAQLAYAQGQYDSWQQILTGSGNVTITAPDGQTISVPALATMLSKSGNLAGLADKATSRRNLGISEFSDSLLDDPDAAAMRSTLGLIKQSATKDNTAGRVMLTGAGGLLGGTYNVVSDDATLAERHAVGVSFTRMGPSNPENPFPGEYVNILMFPETTSSSNGYSGIALSLINNSMAIFRKGGTVKKVRLDDNSSIILDAGMNPTTFTSIRNNGAGKTVKAEFLVSSVSNYVTAILNNVNGVLENGLLLDSGVDGLVYGYGGTGLPTKQKVHHNGNLPHEIGTFTPVVVGTTVAGLGTYTAQYGTYTRIGNRVFFDVILAWAAHTGTGSIRINGMPFAANSAVSSFQFSVYHNNLTAALPISALMGGAAVQIVLRSLVNGVNYADVAMDSSAEIRISGSYQL